MILTMIILRNIEGNSQTNSLSVIKKFQFYVENLLLFKIKSHPEDKQRLFFQDLYPSHDPPDDKPDEQDWYLRSYACQTDFELMQSKQLPQTGISSKELLDQMKIFHDPFQVIPAHSDFFEFILQIYLVSIETLRREFSRSDFEAHLLPSINMVYNKKQEPSDGDLSGPVA